MTIYETNNKEYNNYFIRLVTLNVNHFLGLAFTFILFSIVLIWLAVFFVLPITLLAVFLVYIPNSKYLIHRIIIDDHGNGTIDFLKFSHLQSFQFKIQELDIKIKYPYHTMPGTPNGQPYLSIKSDVFNIRQYTLYQFLKLWQAKEIRTVFEHLREFQQKPMTENELKIIRRIKPIETNLY